MKSLSALNLTPQARADAEAQMATCKKGLQVRPDPIGSGNITRPDTVAMNGTERRYAGLLDARIAAGEVAAYWFQPCSLRMGYDNHYLPDFLVMLASGRLEYHEVKGGFTREDSKEKVKNAASRFYCYKFIIARWIKGAWEYEEVRA